MNRFSSFKKLAACGALLGGIALQPATAGILPKPSSPSVREIGNSETGYTIIRPGEKRADGFTTAAKILSMPRLSPDNYMEGAIHVKTKARFVVNKDAKSFQSSALSTALAPYSVKKVDAAFKEYNNGSLLASDRSGLSRVYTVYYSSPVDAYDVCRELMNNPEVEYASPVFKRKPHYTPNDPKTAEQYELSRIKASQAWDVTKGKAEVLIAITDTGVDWQHEDLADNIWINTKEIPANSKDDDNNGKVDDVRGWDFVGNVTGSDVQQGIFKEDNDPKIYGITATSDMRAHGTVVAGNAAAITNNGKGVASIGHNCKIIPIKVGSDNTSAGGIYKGYEAIEYAARLGADIINCSWGGRGFSPLEADVITQATELGSLIVASSGNEARFTDIEGSYPANHPGVLSVGATGSDDKIASFTNYGIKTLVYAPGVAASSTFPGNKYIKSADWSGTSFSSPIVAGIAGLVKSVHPDWTPAQIAQQIRITSDNVVTSDASLRPLYYGRANAYRAVSLNGTINQGEQAPGVELTSIGLSSNGGMITNNQPTTLRLSLKNYLSNASGVQLQIQSLDGALSIGQGTIDVGALSAMEQKDIDATVQLSAATPFFEGIGEFLVTIKSGTYTNYHRISIPFKIPSTNTYTTLAAGLGDIQFHSASSPGATVAWAAAATPQISGALVFRVQNGTTNYNIVSPNEIYALFAQDGNVAYGGTGPASGAAQILRTTNGGTTGWQATSVSNITPFVNNINFFDANNGIFLGDPLNSAWGIGRSTNAGVSWAKVSNVPAPLSGETGLNTSAYWVGDNGWFGTTKGRVYRTADKGQTWKVSTVLTNGSVSLLTFKDAMNGIAIYRASQANDAQTLAAVTSDGGATWVTNKFNFSNANLYPVYGYNPGDARQTAFLCSNGAVIATEDMGTTWSFIQTKQTGSSTAGAGTINASKVRLWNFGSTMGYLDYAKVAGTIVRELTIASTIQFDTVAIGSKKTKMLTVRNTGETDITISAISLNNTNAEDGEFTLANTPSLPKTIAKGSSITLQAVFNAKQEGNRTATLSITSDADKKISDVAISGQGYKPATSVQDLEAAGIRLLQAFPNPTAAQASFNFEVPSAQNVRLTVSNTLGQTLAIPFEGIAAPGVTTIPFNAASLSNGVYYYTLEIGGQKIVRSFVVQK